MALGRAIPKSRYCADEILSVSLHTLSSKEQMDYRKIVWIMLFWCIGLAVYAQEDVTATVVEKESRQPVVGALITFDGEKKPATVTDASGRFTLKNAAGRRIVIRFIGYKRLAVRAVNRAVYALDTDVRRVEEVVVTAQESRGLGAASTIRRQAMEHLQPSSFGDLLELLPGGRAKDPSLASPNNIRLREALPRSSTNYATSSLGTSFIIDGAPISTNADMQQLKGASDLASTSRVNINRGVDMRTISTDDIEKVEIVRGIPSVEYGELTSGLVKIERKRGGHDFNARLKADMGSKLYYLSKAFEWNNHWTLNTGIDFLDSKRDPRNDFETYRRLSVSARAGKQWRSEHYVADAKLNADYTGSFDGEKSDPELNYGQQNDYRSSYNRYALNFSTSITARRRSLFQAFNATLSGAYEQNTMRRTAFVQLQRTVPAVFTGEDGESDAYLLPYRYTATQEMEGKPVNLFAKINAKFGIPSQQVKNSLLLGADWNMDKNYGRGQVFDPRRPLYPLTSLRPRALSAIPANHTLALYAEENIKGNIAGHVLEAVAGLRLSRMLNIDREYTVAKQFFPDLRLNAGWTLPRFTVAGKAVTVRIAIGVGGHTKNPTVSQLYPDPSYLDISQLNYYHSNEAYRRIYVRTYVIDNVNKDLKPARNFKWEVSTDISVAGNRLSVTFFRENMTSGFRSILRYAPYNCKEYDASGVNAHTLTAPPSLSGLPFTEMSELFGRSYTGNGSQTLKEGIEYTFSSKRFERIHTRLTINGAWFKTTYRNSQAIMERPSAVLDNRRINFVGIYKDDEFVVNEMANTNFTADTNVPRLKLGFSISAQCLWFTAAQRKPLSNLPDAYMKPDGSVQAWQRGDEQDTYLRWLMRNYTPSFFKRDVVPFSMNVNFKVTQKLLKDKINIAMFCNKLFDYTPDYKDGSLTIRRHVNPYFGLELNMKL